MTKTFEIPREELNFIKLKLSEGNDRMSRFETSLRLADTVSSRLKNLQWFKEYFIEEKYSKWKP